MKDGTKRRRPQLPGASKSGKVGAAMTPADLDDETASDRRVDRVLAAPAFAVISDLHGNLVALDAVLADLDAQGISGVLCLGDVVGYGPEPAGCLRRLRERRIPCLRGNHDEAAVDRVRLGEFNDDAAAGIRFTRKQLGAADRAYLKVLPWSWIRPGFAFVHASFPAPELYHYLFSPHDAELHLAGQSVPVSFFGHTHRQGAFRAVGKAVIPTRNDAVLTWEPGDRWAVNPGSVGQPRDDDPRAAYVVCEPAARRIRFHRVAYDVAATQAAMRGRGLPARLIQRLEAGW